jgi:hypothetical protein
MATGFSVVLRETTERATVIRAAAIGAAVAAVLFFLAPLFSRRASEPGGGGGGGGARPLDDPRPGGEALPERAGDRPSTDRPTEEVGV